MSDAVARGSMIFQRGEGRGARSEERGEGRGVYWRLPAFQLLRTTRTNISPRPHENRDRLNSRKNSRKPGIDRSPRPTQVPVPATRNTDWRCGRIARSTKFRYKDQGQLNRHTQGTDQPKNTTRNID